MYSTIKNCRICKNTNLVEVVNLGNMMLTGVFPEFKDEKITSGPLSLVKCTGDEDCCGLLQLMQTYSSSELYGDNYGYRSGLNKSMVKHLHEKVKIILNTITPQPGDLIIDIGSNDGTTLAAYPLSDYTLVGIDPTGVKFKDFYKPHIQLIPDFFSKKIINNMFGNKKAKVVTSFAMFYDLEDPISFMQEIYYILDDEGIWVSEQSYMPTMINNNSFDTICHEHLEYYALKQIKWMTDIVGFKIIRVDFNAINGGSISIIVAKNSSQHREATNLDAILFEEEKYGFTEIDIYTDFAKRIEKVKSDLTSFIKEVNINGQNVYGLGASTKGNVLLQYCGLSDEDIPFIGEVNSEKYGRFTPGSNIPIISEQDLLMKNPDYALILPWHFREFFLKIPTLNKLKLVFPLPNLEIVNR